MSLPGCLRIKKAFRFLKARFCLYLYKSDNQNLHEEAGGDVTTPPPIAIHAVNFGHHYD